MSKLRMNGYQIKRLMDLINGEDETEISLQYYRESRPDGNSGYGEIMPPGLYAWFTDYPEEGQLYLPENQEQHDKAEIGV